MQISWNILSLALAVSIALVIVLAWLLWQERSRLSRLPDRWALVPRPVLSKTERQVLDKLRQALPQHLIMAKLPLVRFCQPLDVTGSRQWYDLIGPCYVTFAVCSTEGRVLLVMDLEHRGAPSRRMEKIKFSVLAACRIKHMKLSPQQLPSAAEFRNLLQAPARPVPQVPREPALGETMKQASASLLETLKSRRQGRQGSGDSRFADDSFFAPLSNFGELQPTPHHTNTDRLATRSSGPVDAGDTMPLESQQRLARGPSGGRPFVASR